MTQLRRCSPEIERELHDKEARIRELEGAMDEAWGVIANASDWIPKEPGTPCERSRADWQETAERWRDERFHPLLRATSPPDSELAEGEGDDDDPHEDPHHEKGDPTVHKSFHGGYVWTYCDECGPDVKVDEDGLCIACGKDAVYFGKEPDDTAERQDAMLERREALERLIEEIRVNGLSDDTEDQLRQALSRTSDDTMRHALFILRHGESPPEVTREDTIRRLERAIEGKSMAEDTRDLLNRARHWLGAPEAVMTSATGRNIVNNLIERIDQALSRTSDEGGGCVVPDAMLERRDAVEAILTRLRDERDEAVALLRACRVHVRHAAKTGTQEQQDAALRLDVNIDALLRRVGGKSDE